jgi:hypothetical protein
VISEQTEKVLKLFAEGLKHYKLMEFGNARACFEEALRIDPNDGPSGVYFERCRDYEQNPPAQPWDGVYVMKNK